MRLALMIEPQQGLTYEEQLDVARHVESAGLEALFRSDHYVSFPGPDDNPTTDAWAVLAGLARETSRIGLGALVSPVTFRSPGNLAKVVTTVDEMSGGRIELGVGAGWNDLEHRRHGLAFPPIGERADILEETLEILHGLWEGPDGWSFSGRHHQIEDALFRPKPRMLPARNGRRPRLLVGGGGTARSMRIAAKYADEFNLSSGSADVVAGKFQQLDMACHAIGRDPGTIVHSAMVGVLIGADRDELGRRERDLLATFGSDDGEDWLEERRLRWIYGTPDQARATLHAFATAGVERLMLQDFVPRDLEMIDLIGRELVEKA